MKRKVVKQGPATLMVSLPSKWAKKNNVNAGDEINLEENKNALILSKENTILQKEISINIDTSNEIARRIIGDLYKDGYTVVKVTSNNPEIITSIKKRIVTKIGYEVVELKKNSCIIKTIANIDMNSFEDMINKFFNVLVSLVIFAREKSEKKEIPDLNELNDMLTKIYNCCNRILRNESFDNSNKYSNVILLREGFYFGRYMIELIENINDEKQNNSIIRIVDIFEKSIKTIYSCYYNYDSKKIDDVFLLLDDLVKKNSIILKKYEQSELLYCLALKLKEMMGPIIDLKIENMINKNSSEKIT
jgi:phosphate uptake regulator